MRRQPRRGLPEWKNEIGAVPLGSGTNSESGAYRRTDRTVAIRLWRSWIPQKLIHVALDLFYLGQEFGARGLVRFQQDNECVKKPGVGRGMAFEINVDCRLPNSHLRRKPNVSIGQKPG